jgi:outer membrane protein OmpA-like peptidoglycan-associated protein
MIVEAEGYLPQLINIHIPNQTYFYELFQEIHLNSIKQTDKAIGEEITIKNTFYDIYKVPENDSVENLIDTLKPKDYSQLLNFIEKLIVTTDSLSIYKLDSMLDKSNKFSPRDTTVNNNIFIKLLDLIDKAIQTTDTTALKLLDKDTKYDEKVTQSYYYEENNSKKNLPPVVIGKDTVYTAPPVNTINPPEKKEEISKPLPKPVETTKAEPQPVKPVIKDTVKKEKQLILSYTIYFEKNSYSVKEEYLSKLNEIAELLKNNSGATIEIEGYTDTQGSSDYNMKLSNQRTKSVLDILIKKGIHKHCAKTRGFGESKSAPEKTENEKIQNRRVEIKVIK